MNAPVYPSAYDDGAAPSLTGNNAAASFVINAAGSHGAPPPPPTYLAGNGGNGAAFIVTTAAGSHGAPPPPTWLAGNRFFELFSAAKANPHLNECLASSSLLPELCCALQFPWFMAARVYARLAGPAAGHIPALIAAAGFIILLPFYIFSYWDSAAAAEADLTGRRTRAAPAALVVCAALAVLAFFVGVAILRGRVRAARGIAGSRAGDACAVVPWLCCVPVSGYAFELAAMDRELAPAAAAALRPLPAAAVAGAAPRTDWSTSLFGCGLCSLTGGLPQYYCATFFPSFIVLRVLLRLGLAQPERLIAIVAVKVLLPLSLLLAGVTLHNAVLVLIALLLYATNIIGIVIASWLRITVRERLAIAGTHSDDVLQAACCAPCSLAQLDRETAAAMAALGAAAAAAGAAEGAAGGAAPWPLGQPRPDAPPREYAAPPMMPGYAYGLGAPPGVAAGAEGEYRYTVSPVLVLPPLQQQQQSMLTAGAGAAPALPGHAEWQSQNTL